MNSFAGMWQRLVEFLAKKSHIILKFQKNIENFRLNIFIHIIMRNFLLHFIILSFVLFMYMNIYVGEYTCIHVHVDTWGLQKVYH